MATWSISAAMTDNSTKSAREGVFLVEQFCQCGEA